MPCVATHLAWDPRGVTGRDVDEAAALAGEPAALCLLLVGIGELRMRLVPIGEVSRLSKRLRPTVVQVPAVLGRLPSSILLRVRPLQCGRT